MMPANRNPARVGEGEFAVASGHRRPLFRLVESPFDHVASLVGLRIEVRWPPARAAHVHPVRCLIGLLGDYRLDASAAQQFPVGP